MKLSLMWGHLKRAWDYIRPMLLSQVGKFLADAEVRRLALAAVERATGLDLDGDGKHDHATAELIAALNAIRMRYRRAWCAVAVEAAYQYLRRVR